MVTRLVVGRMLVALAGLASLFAAQPARAQCADCILVDQFENAFFLPQNDAEAARFLTQATFGVTRNDIATVRSQGFEGWIIQQGNLPQSLTRPALTSYAATLTGTNEISQTDRIDLWFRYAITASDQLRMRMAFALSQIIVISDQADALNGEEIMMAEWQDILVRNAFGNYRTLLEEVTRSPMMGRYLTHLRNRKKEGSIAPDENYAREIMQLFSVGLIERNSDFTPIDGDPGTPGVQTVPTYDQNIITNLARVFTGLSYRCNGGTTTITGSITSVRDCDGNSGNGVNGVCNGTDCNYITGSFGSTPPTPNGDVGHGLVHPDNFAPMICYPRYHDTGRDTAGVLYPPRPAPPYTAEPYQDKRIIGFEPPNAMLPSDRNCHLTSPTSGTAADRLACLTYCDNEITQALDALFMHPNLPPFVARQLIQRFVTSNPTPAYIGRVAAVFADNNGAAAGGTRGDLGATIKAVLLDAEARATPTDPNYGKLREPLLRLTAVWRALGAQSGDNRRWGLTSLGSQRPLGANSVFNFYEPDYQSPGQIANAGLFSPEFQILDETSIVGTANTLWTRIFAGYNSGTGAFTQPTDQGFIPPASLDALPATNDGLLEELNLRLMYGSMSGSLAPTTGMKGVLKNTLDLALASVDQRRKALFLTHLIMMSPEFAIQR